jgi:hypothetical protein
MLTYPSFKQLEFHSWAEFRDHVLTVIEDGIDGVPITDMWFRGQ